MSDRPIILSLQATIALAPNEVWPDGEAPDEITAAAVKEAMESAGSKTFVLREWSLIDELDVTVEVSRPNRNYRQDEVLFGDPLPKRFHETVEVWQ